MICTYNGIGALSFCGVRVSNANDFWILARALRAALRVRVGVGEKSSSSEAAPPSGTSSSSGSDSPWKSLSAPLLGVAGIRDSLRFLGVV
jgi:hypothetical protein